MRYFFDTSAIVKLYHHEPGTEIVLPLYRESASIEVSELSKVEFLSAIHKKLRTGEITGEILEAVRDRFVADCSNRFVVVHAASMIVDAALDILGTRGRLHHLFSLDALQIATYSVVDDGETIFVCADKRLAALVEAIGYPVLRV